MLALSTDALPSSSFASLFCGNRLVSTVVTPNCAINVSDQLDRCWLLLPEWVAAFSQLGSEFVQVLVGEQGRTNGDTQGVGSV